MKIRISTLLLLTLLEVKGSDLLKTPISLDSEGTPGAGRIHEQVVEVAAICKGNSTKMQSNLDYLVSSMLVHSPGTNIRLTLLSDQESWPLANEIVSRAIGRYLTKGIVYGHGGVATLNVEYVDLDHLISTVMDRDLIKTMKRIFGPANKTLVLKPDDPRRPTYYPDDEPGIAIAIVSGDNDKDLDLFYIAPFYHRLFPEKDNLIVVDLDLEFRVALEQVHQLFSSMSDSQLMAFVPDQSPWYPFITGGTSLPRQGVNSGLVLFKLKSMRENREYNEELTSERMESLSRRFLPNHDWNLGDQEWFSLLSWERSHLVKLLPCQFNVFKCSWPPISPSPLFRNLPCNEKPAVLHFCGSYDTR